MGPISSLITRCASRFEEEEQPGRILSTREFAQAIALRPDIFAWDESEKRMRLIEAAFLGIGVSMTLWMRAMNPISFGPEMPFEIQQPPAATIHDPVAPLPDVAKPEPRVHERSGVVAPHGNRGTRNAHGNGIRSGRAGRGIYQTIRDRAMQHGLLGILGGRIIGVGVHGDPDGLGGSARGIDRALRGLRGLAAGIEGSGRRGLGAVTGLGAGDYGNGAGSGEGCCGDIGIDDLMPREAPLHLDHKAQTIRTIAPDIHPIPENWAPISGGRNSAEIMQVVRQNLASLRHAYNRYLRQGSAIAGKITVEFAIDGSGRVVSCRIVNSTIDNSRLENEIMGIISRWVFKRIDTPDDITVAVYPFAFSS